MYTVSITWGYKRLMLDLQPRRDSLFTGDAIQFMCRRPLHQKVRPKHCRRWPAPSRWPHEGERDAAVIVTEVTHDRIQQPVTGPQERHLAIYSRLARERHFGTEPRSHRTLEGKGDLRTRATGDLEAAPGRTPRLRPYTGQPSLERRARAVGWRPRQEDAC